MMKFDRFFLIAMFMLLLLNYGLFGNMLYILLFGELNLEELLEILLISNIKYDLDFINFSPPVFSLF